MRFIKNSKIRLIKSLIRFFFTKFIIRSKLKTKGLSLIGSNVSLIVVGKMKLGFKAQIDDYVELQTKGILTIGNNFTINKFSRIVCYDKITIGDNCVIAQFVSIIDHNHNYQMDGENIKFRNYLTSSILIGNNVWIADKVTILKGVEIGNNVIIGANSVVTKNIPSNSIAAGNPCRVIKSINNMDKHE